MLFIRCGAVGILCLALAIIFGCSSDNEDTEESLVEEIVAPEEDIEPEEPPEHWEDSVIEITVGNQRTGQGVLAFFERKRKEIKISDSVKRALKWDDFPYQQEKYDSRTVEVSIVSMQDVGMNEPASLAEVRERYRQFGYRPLTLEEAVELRIQFLDQPPISSGHPTSAFLVLFSEEDSKYLNPGGKKSRRIWKMDHAEVEYIFRDVFDPFYPPLTLLSKMYAHDDPVFDPHSINPTAIRVLKPEKYRYIWPEKDKLRRGTWFACAYINQ